MGEWKEWAIRLPALVYTLKLFQHRYKDVWKYDRPCICYSCGSSFVIYSGHRRAGKSFCHSGRMSACSSQNYTKHLYNIFGFCWSNCWPAQYPYVYVHCIRWRVWTEVPRKVDIGAYCIGLILWRCLDSTPCFNQYGTLLRCYISAKTEIFAKR